MWYPVLRTVSKGGAPEQGPAARFSTVPGPGWRPRLGSISPRTGTKPPAGDIHAPQACDGGGRRVDRAGPVVAFEAVDETFPVLRSATDRGQVGRRDEPAGDVGGPGEAGRADEGEHGALRSRPAGVGADVVGDVDLAIAPFSAPQRLQFIGASGDANTIGCRMRNGSDGVRRLGLIRVSIVTPVRAGFVGTGGVSFIALDGVARALGCVCAGRSQVGQQHARRAGAIGSVVGLVHLGAVIGKGDVERPQVTLRLRREARVQRY